jgi:hypothetical protein
MTNDSAVAKTISRLGKQEAHPYTSVKNDILQENNGSNHNRPALSLLTLLPPLPPVLSSALIHDIQSV